MLHLFTEAFAISRVKPVVAKQDLLSIIFRDCVQTIEGEQHLQQCCAFFPPDANSSDRRSSQGGELNQGNLPIDAGLVVGGTDGLLRFFKVNSFSRSCSFNRHYFVLLLPRLDNFLCLFRANICSYRSQSKPMTMKFPI